jgi:hypothetical protein
MTTIQPEVTTERVAMITFLLCSGRRFRTAEVAALMGLTRQGAYAQLARIARVVPVVLDGGEWFLAKPGDDRQQPVDGEMIE